MVSVKGRNSAKGEFDDGFFAELFAALTAGTESYISCVDRQRRFLYLNRTMSRSLDQILGQPMETFTAPAHQQVTVETVERAFESGLPQELTFDVQLADGSTRVLVTRVLPFRRVNGEQAALMITDDQTETRTLSDKLEQSEAFRSVVVENLPDFVSLIDRERRFVWVNRLAPGLNRADVLGTKLDAFLSEEARPLALAEIERVFQEGTPGHFEAEGYRDGVVDAWYLTRVVPIASRGTIENVLLLTSDVSERKQAEFALRDAQEQLHQAQRQESIGQLAGGIAHDFNNLLQVLEGTLYFAREGLRRGESVLEELEQAHRATERAAELTSHLLAIGRRKRVDPTRVDLGVLIEQSLRMLRRAIPANVQLHFAPPAEHCFAEVDAPQFEQVLINLCVNARDAMPNGGALSVEVGLAGASDVTVSVKDTGVGITRDDLPRIFEPFFTTKGAGSGLGLAVAAGIIAAHGGTLGAESEVGRGTTVTITLPRAEVTAEHPASIASEPGGGAEVILVAEDEETVRKQMVRILEGNGYTVLQAPNGTRAVELFRERRDDIALVLLDVIMPELDGWHAFLEMDKLRPGLKVLFSTGYAANVVPADFSASGARMLSKPYKPQTLLSQVREALDV
jgi:PAS domain S-box-containing protein